MVNALKLTRRIRESPRKSTVAGANGPAPGQIARILAAAVFSIKNGNAIIHSNILGVPRVIFKIKSATQNKFSSFVILIKLKSQKWRKILYGWIRNVSTLHSGGGFICILISSCLEFRMLFLFLLSLKYYDSHVKMRPTHFTYRISSVPRLHLKQFHSLESITRKTLNSFTIKVAIKSHVACAYFFILHLNFFFLSRKTLSFILPANAQ